MNPDDVIRIGDMVTMHDIAKLCDVSKPTVAQWRTRFGNFPTPNYLGPARGNGSQPFWNWTDVESWLDLHPTLGNRD